MTFDTPPLADGHAPASPPFPDTPQESGVAAHKFVSFFLGEKQYALPAHAVAEVVGCLTPTRLPDAPPALLGIAPLRGDILAIVDTGTKTQPAQSLKRKTVVLRPGQSVELPVAFNVDQLGEILKVSAEQIRSSSEIDPLAEFETTVGDKRVLLIEPIHIQNLLSASEQ